VRSSREQLSAPPWDLRAARWARSIGVLVERTLQTIGQRLFAREEERAREAAVQIAADARERQEQGEQVRDDGFFDEDGRLRSDGEELLEGVLRQAAAAYEERTVPLLARLYSSIAFDPQVGPGDAFFLVRLAGALTYRQFVALGVHYDENREGRIALKALKDDGPGHSSYAVEAELRDLAGPWPRRPRRRGWRAAAFGDT
jgi:hypothetical protein